MTLNKPVLLMTFPSGTKAEARALPIRDALAWSEDADKLHEAYADATQKGDRKAQTDALLSIIDLVADYPWLKCDAEKIKEGASSEQVIFAFYELRDINDPFVVAAQREERSQKEQMANAKEIMAMLPEKQREQILADQFGKLQ